MRRLIVSALLTLAAPLSAWGQGVLIRTDPPRATLVCDGRVVGITPVALLPSAISTCTLFAQGHANLAFDPRELVGAIASFRLAAVAPTPDLPCGAIDPRTGLVRVCGESPAAPAARVDPPRECGQINPATGLMVVCFTDAARPARPAPSSSTVRCGQLDPRTGLLRVCLGEVAPARPPARPRPRARGVACGQVDPDTGLLRVCFR